MKPGRAASFAVSAFCLVRGANAEVPTIPDLPTSPAFTALDLNPTAVSRPTSAGTFGASMISAVDAGGRIVPGVALDVAPVWLAMGADKTLDDWRNSAGTRLASRFSLSLATARLQETEQATGVAAALRAVFIDASDPRLDPELAKCIQDELEKFKIEPVTVPPAGADFDDAEVRVKAPSLEVCKSAARERSQDKGWKLAAAFAYAADSGTGKVEDLGSRSVDLWLDVGYGVAPNERLSFGFGAVARGRYLDETNTSAADSGLSIRLQLQNRFRLEAAGTWKPQDLSDLGSSAEAYAFGGKTELRVYADTWASVDINYQGGDDSPISGVLGLGQLRHAF